MQTMMTGFLAWAKMRNTNNEAIKLMDSAITVVATLLVAVTWAVLRA